MAGRRTNIVNMYSTCHVDPNNQLTHGKYPQMQSCTSGINRSRLPFVEEAFALWEGNWYRLTMRTLSFYWVELLKKAIAYQDENEQAAKHKIEEKPNNH